MKLDAKEMVKREKAELLAEIKAAEELEKSRANADMNRQKSEQSDLERQQAKRAMADRRYQAERERIKEVLENNKNRREQESE